MRLPSLPWPWRRAADADRPPAPVAAPLPPPARAAASLPAPGAAPLPLANMAPADRLSWLLRQVVDPVLAEMERQGVRSDDRARVMLLAIARQESDAWARRQHGNGPARGLWQFERGGGVAGVLAHRTSAGLAAAWCADRRVEPSASAVHLALERDDALACAFARLLLWTDPQPMPAEEEAGFACYLRCWRPGAWSRGDAAERAKLRAKWGRMWGAAQEAVRRG